MERILDIHVHSRFSRATSPDLTVMGLARGALIKGIEIIGTGDFTHPAWQAELAAYLEPAEPGLWQLKPVFDAQVRQQVPASVSKKTVRFMLTVEVSVIYRRHNRTRKLHHIILAPDLVTVEKINEALSVIGNLAADGRPIFGLDSYDLLRILLDIDQRCELIPAHVWTPWFGLYGSHGGFNSIEEAFGDLSSHIHAVETGLSSDPAMNARVTELDTRTIISNSDAHSAGKLGREATVVNTGLSYDEVLAALRSNDHRLVGTIEFYPQEGKYHYDGHRACGIRFSPNESVAHKNICPVCGKPLVLGVAHRVGEVASRPATYHSASAKRVEYIVPLPEILAQLRGVKSTASKAVQQEHHKLIERFGDEFFLLRHVDLQEVSQAGWPQLAEALQRMRTGQIYAEPGYDGVFGTISVLPPSPSMTQQLNLT